MRPKVIRGQNRQEQGRVGRKPVSRVHGNVDVVLVIVDVVFDGIHKKLHHRVLYIVGKMQRLHDHVKGRLLGSVCLFSARLCDLDLHVAVKADRLTKDSQGGIDLLDSAKQGISHLLQSVAAIRRFLALEVKVQTRLALLAKSFASTQTPRSGGYFWREAVAWQPRQTAK